MTVRSVGLNLAFSLATVAASGGITWAVSKYAHSYFEVTKNWAFTPSFLIRQIAFCTGAATGGLIAWKASPVLFDRNITFLHAHALHLITWIFPAALALNELFTQSNSRNVNLMTNYACVAGMSAIPIAAAAFGKNGLYAGAVIGTLSGLLIKV